MPLFMDRHDLPGATAEQVAQAHRSDLGLEAKPLLLAPCLEHRAGEVDADNGEAFCLARARRTEDMQAVHRESHGLIANEVIGVSEDNVLRFLGKIADPVDPTQLTSAFRTILFTDLKGSTTLLQELGESAYMVLLTEHDLIIRRALVASRGREVKHTGDGIMASFDDVAHALECAAAVQVGFDWNNDGDYADTGEGYTTLSTAPPVPFNSPIFYNNTTLAPVTRTVPSSCTSGPPLKIPIHFEPSVAVVEPKK